MQVMIGISKYNNQQIKFILVYSQQHNTAPTLPGCAFRRAAGHIKCIVKGFCPSSKTLNLH